MKLSNAHSRLLESLASGFHHVGPNSWAFTELGRKDVKVDILISRLMGLNVQQFAFKLSDLTQMSLAIQFITGQVIFLCNHWRSLTVGVNYRIRMYCWKPIKRSTLKMQDSIPSHKCGCSCVFYSKGRSVKMLLNAKISLNSQVWNTMYCIPFPSVVFWKQSTVVSRWKKKGASALWRAALTVMDCS